jgi:hypothetical protein
MSITFFPAPGAPTGFRVGCSCEDNQGPVFGTYADAEAFYTKHDLLNTTIPEVLVGCEYLGQEGYCEMGMCHIRAVYAEEAPSLNVANGNAIVLLEALGLLGEVRDTALGPMAMDACGAMDAEAFLGRVLCAEVMSVGDPGTESETLAEEGCATMVMVGRPEGYVDSKLSALREIALWAQAHDVAVVWG